MTNHVHLIAIPDSRSALSRAIGITNLIYAQYINRLHGRSGHVWQDRFHSCPMDGAHELAATRYVERNPVRAEIVDVAWRYPWSSAATHCRKAVDRQAIELLDIPRWREHLDSEQWATILEAPDDPRLDRRVRQRTARGLPLGSDRFVAKLEVMLNRRLRPARRGRPCKPDIRPSSLERVG